MPESVELRLIADNSQAVKAVRELGVESQKLYTNNEKGQKRQIGLIADVEKELGKLQTAQKNAMSIEAIEKYNKKIAEAKTALDEYNKAGLKVEKQSETMTQSIGKWVAGLGVAVTVMNLLKTAFKDTIAGMLAFNVAGAATKQVLYNIVTGVGDWNKGVAQSIILAKQRNDLLLNDRMEMVKSKELMREYNKLYTESIENNDTGAVKIAALTKAKEKYQTAIGIEINSTKKQLELELEALKLAPQSLSAQNKVVELYSQLQDLLGSQESGIRRISRQIAAEQEKLFSDVLTITSDFQKDIQDIIDDIYKEEAEKAKKAKEESEKIEKEFTEAMRVELQKRRKERERLGAEEMQRLEKEYKDKVKLTKDKVDNQISIEKKYYDWFWDQSDKQAKKEQEDADKEKDRKQATIDAVLEVTDRASEFTLALYDRQFSKLENQYNAEEKIAEKKFDANIKAAGKNEALKAKLTEQYNLSRAKSEEAYNKKKNEIARKAAIAEKLSAIFSIGINTAVAITKALPNLVLAAFVTAAGVLAAATVVAKPIPQFAKGGWTGEGSQRDSSGERMAGVVHEREFVVRKGPAHKFRSVLEAINRDDRRMILNSFNKLSPEAGNNILVENTGPNKRLDEVNSNLRHIRNKEEVTVIGNMTIYKKGNTTRIIKR